jgi:predicted porin
MKGPFGEVYLGRIGAIMSAAGPMAVAGWYTPFGSSCGKYAVTAYNYMFNFQRLDNSVSYRSPKIGNVRLLAQVSSDVNTLEDLDSATDGIQHGTEWKDSTGHYYGVGLQYDAKNVNFNFGADRLTYSRTLQGTKPKDSYNVTGGGFVTLDKFKVYAGAQLFSHATSKWILTYNQIWGGSRYLKGYAVMGGVGYKLWGGELLGAAGYSRAENASGSPKLMNRTYGVSVGYEYPITKRTSFYLMVNGNYSTLKENGKLPSRASTLESTMGLSHFF